MGLLRSGVASYIPVFSIELPAFEIRPHRVIIKSMGRFPEL
ncbi:hypothetical protein D3OALGA1CA_4806 [Olavius algarvensis associated proteobacterium Delta 3]|nr:hypothetical protein D3OALGA1CA_4806 [Olavius algarvensis associated proteobacterium Delta 3]